MLKNLNPHLNADLLHVLRSMGHGDELILADCNFPSDSVAAHTVSGKLIRMEGLNIPEVAEAITFGLSSGQFCPRTGFTDGGGWKSG